MSFSLQAPPPHRTETSAFDDSDADTASQRSISLSSPAHSPRQSTSFPSSTSTKRASEPHTLDTDLSSEADDLSLYNRRESPSTSVAPSIYDDTSALPTYPPSLPGDTDSIASTSSRKARPESLLMNLSAPLVLGVALVDFNHLVRLPSCLLINLIRIVKGWSQNRVFQRRDIRGRRSSEDTSFPSVARWCPFGSSYFFGRYRRP